MQIDITPEPVLTVSGERKTDLCTGWDERSQERHFGQFERLFALADDADTSTINANLKLGVLTVTVKKKKIVKGQRVEVTIDLQSLTLLHLLTGCHGYILKLYGNPLLHWSGN